MKAMILAAGRGERMRPLTDSIPKPLLELHGKPLIQWQIEQLKTAGINDIVINVSWLKDQLAGFLGDGTAFGVNVSISEEPPGALETAGGIVQALDQLGDRFVVVNSDVFTNFNFDGLKDLPAEGDLAHLVLVDNPAHNRGGDFVLQDGRLTEGTGGEEAANNLTFSGIGVYRRELFAGLEPGPRKLAPVLQQAISKGRVSGSRFDGRWMDIGTPERLAQASRS